MLQSHSTAAADADGDGDDGEDADAECCDQLLRAARQLIEHICAHFSNNKSHLTLVSYSHSRCHLCFTHLVL